MINIETLSYKIAAQISRNLKLDKEKQEIIGYGMFAIIHIIISIICVVIFGIIFDVLIEALIICFTGSVLKKYSGGAHASTPNFCIVIGTTVCIGEALLISLLLTPLVNSVMVIILGIISFSYSYLHVYKLAPVDSPAKPIKTKKKIDKMKKRSIIVLNFYLIMVVLNLVMYIYFTDERFAVYSLCILGGTFWQSFTLTKLGHTMINKFDAFIHKPLEFIGRRDSI